MLILPTILLTLSGISGAGGIALSVKSVVDSMQAASTNRYVQERNERNLLRFEAVSRKLDKGLETLGEQRMVIAKNFSVFIKAFEQIHNRPDFSTKENVQSNSKTSFVDSGQMNTQISLDMVADYKVYAAEMYLQFRYNW